MVLTGKVMALEQWSLGSDEEDHMLPPEVRPIRLHGVVDDHPRLGKNRRVSTSRIVGVEGRIVTTRSGSKYRLGEPHPDYVAWCKERGYHDPTDEKDPIRTLLPDSVN